MSAAPFVPLHCSLADLLGEDYLTAVCDAHALLSGEDRDELQALAHAAVDAYPATFHQRQLDLLAQVGWPCEVSRFISAKGASSRKYVEATKTAMAPVNGYGFYRVGEDGRLYLTTKSEHYHAPVGHAFPGYALLDTARRLGIPNATHNNTRGHITRLLEEALVRTAHGLPAGDKTTLTAVLDGAAPRASIVC